MNIKTKEKIERVKQAYLDGYTEQEIYRISKSKSKGEFQKFIEKHSNLIFGTASKEIEVIKEQTKLPSTRETFFQDQNNFERLVGLVEKYEEIMGSLGKTTSDVSEAFEIPTEHVKLDDLKLTSIRLSKDLLSDLDGFCKKYPTYSKTAIVNHLIRNSLEKFK